MTTIEEIEWSHSTRDYWSFVKTKIGPSNTDQSIINVQFVKVNPYLKATCDTCHFNKSPKTPELECQLHLPPIEYEDMFVQQKSRTCQVSVKQTTYTS